MAFDGACRILADLPDDFKLGIFGPEVEPLLRESLDETGRWHQRRCQLTAPLMMWFVPALMLFRDRSIPDVLKTLVSALRHQWPDLNLKQVTPEALCHARARLGVEPMKALYEKTARTIKPPPTFHGLRMWSMDGVQFLLQDTSANEEEFGRPSTPRGRAAFPQIQGILLVSTHTHEVRDAQFDPCKQAERPGAEALLRSLGPDDLVAVDQGFAAGWLFESFQRAGVHVLSRIPGHWKPRLLERLGPGDYLVEMKTQAPSPEERRQGKKSVRRKMRLRMIEYRVGRGPWIRLLTDLRDPERYPARELAALYHERWESEVVHDEMKSHLASVPTGTVIVPFRSKSPDGVLQEAYGLLVAYNLVRALMLQAAEEHGFAPREISFVETLRVLRLGLPRFQGATEAERRQLRMQLLRDIADCRLSRPRRPRSYPRGVKIKMSNYRLKKPKDKEKHLDSATELEMREAS